MGKGHQGETCWEALREIMKPGKVYSFSVLFGALKERGGWSDDTIWLHLIGNVVNLVPADYHWPRRRPILFLRGDGQYELYDPEKHPKIIS